MISPSRRSSSSPRRRWLSLGRTSVSRARPPAVAAPPWCLRGRKTTRCCTMLRSRTLPTCGQRMVRWWNTPPFCTSGMSPSPMKGVTSVSSPTTLALPTPTRPDSLLMVSRKLLSHSFPQPESVQFSGTHFWQAVTPEGPFLMVRTSKPLHTTILHLRGCWKMPCGEHMPSLWWLPSSQALQHILNSFSCLSLAVPVESLPNEMAKCKWKYKRIQRRDNGVYFQVNHRRKVTLVPCLMILSGVLDSADRCMLQKHIVSPKPFRCIL